jgi:UrcA family protein
MKALILCGAMFALAAPAAAEVRPARGQPDVLETTVEFSDLDLNRTSDADMMLARLRRAAREVCGLAPLPHELGKGQRHRACVAATMDATVARVDAPLVTARYGGRDTATLAAR